MGWGDGRLELRCCRPGSSRQLRRVGLPQPPGRQNTVMTPHVTTLRVTPFHGLLGEDGDSFCAHSHAVSTFHRFAISRE